MNRQLDKYIAILPFVFAAHNIEEAISFGIVQEFSFYVVKQAQFIIAVSLFSILGFMVVFCKKLYQNDSQYRYFITGFAGMLFLNAFFPHIIATLYFKAYMPGVITAILLILPLTGYILRETYRLSLFSKQQFITTIITGGMIGAVLVVFFLGIGWGVLWLSQKHLTLSNLEEIRFL